MERLRPTPADGNKRTFVIESGKRKTTAFFCRQRFLFCHLLVYCIINIKVTTVSHINSFVSSSNYQYYSFTSRCFHVKYIPANNSQQIQGFSPENLGIAMEINFLSNKRERGNCIFCDCMNNMWVSPRLLIPGTTRVIGFIVGSLYWL